MLDVRCQMLDVRFHEKSIIEVSVERLEDTWIYERPNPRKMRSQGDQVATKLHPSCIQNLQLGAKQLHKS